MSATIEGLRAATRDVHERLHTNRAFAPLMASPPDAAGYARLLHRLRGFHVPTEASLFAAAARLIPGLDDLPRRRKAHLLDDDIAKLDRLFPPSEGGRATTPPADLSPARLLGCLYVIEGATLGGRELGRSLAPVLRALGMEGLEGRRFLLAYDPDQGLMWRHFCAALTQVADDFAPPDRASMELAAREMFLALETWLDDPAE